MLRLALLTAGLLAFTSPSHAHDDAAACLAAVAAMRVRAEALPPNNLSRRFAEADLGSALVELDAGDPEECEEFVERAGQIIEQQPYVLRPGELLQGYGPDGPLMRGSTSPD